MFRIDATPQSSVVVCSCGWREVATNRVHAWNAAARHEAIAHPGQRFARQKVAWHAWDTRRRA